VEFAGYLSLCRRGSVTFVYFLVSSLNLGKKTVVCNFLQAGTRLQNTNLTVNQFEGLIHNEDD
jgi:hypothetical protein